MSASLNAMEHWNAKNPKQKQTNKRPLTRRLWTDDHRLSRTQWESGLQDSSHATPSSGRPNPTCVRAKPDQLTVQTRRHKRPVQVFWVRACDSRRPTACVYACTGCTRRLMATFCTRWNTGVGTCVQGTVTDTSQETSHEVSSFF